MAHQIHNRRIFANACSFIRDRFATIIGLIGVIVLGYIMIMSLVMLLSAGYHYLVGETQIFSYALSDPRYLIYYVDPDNNATVLRIAARENDFPIITSIYAILFTVILVAGFVIMDGWRYVVYNRIVQQRPAITSDELWRLIYLVPTFLLAHIFYGICSTIGIFLLVVPAIVFYIAVALYPYIIADTNVGAVQSFIESYQLLRGNKWNLFKLWFVGGLISLTPMIIFTLFFSKKAIYLDENHVAHISRVPDVSTFFSASLLYVCTFIFLVWMLVVWPLCLAQYYQILSSDTDDQAMPSDQQEQQAA